MSILADLVASYHRTPSARCYLDGKHWDGAWQFSRRAKFGESIATGSVTGHDPPVRPQIGMPIRWEWGYNGQHKAGFTGEVSDPGEKSYPRSASVQCKDVLWRADKSNQVLQTDPLNDILARDAAIYLLTHYGGISASRIHLPALLASGTGWAGSEWTLGRLTPVQWGDADAESGGTSALKAAVEIYACMGYWLYADAGGIIRARQTERKPSEKAREVFKRDLNLLISGSPERKASYEWIFNLVTVLGAETGVDGAQLRDVWRSNHPLLPPDVDRDYPFSSALLEYINESEAGAASVTAVAKRIHKVVSRVPDVVSFRAKADPERAVGDTVGILDIGVSLPKQRNFFIYEQATDMDLHAGRFDDQLTLDGGIGSSGFTLIPPPEASFTWELMRETLDGVPVVEVALKGSASNSPTGEIVSYAWSTSTPTYSGTPASATGEEATLIFEAADSPAAISLTVLDTTSKTGTLADVPVDLTGADTVPPIVETVIVAAGASAVATPDGGQTWNEEVGTAISVSIIGAGVDDRAALGTSPALLATRTGGLRLTLDALATASTDLAASLTVTSNIWVNEANPLRVWWAEGTAVYRSLDQGVTSEAMAAAPDTVTWIMEDPALENSVFLLSGADMLNATAPELGWALLYAGPVGSTARQFVRSRDGQVTWVCYIGAPTGEALQRVETGAAADFDATDVRSLALDRNATSLRAALYAVTGDDPAQIWSFDGLTGLTAVQSSQFFASGATVQHMLTSRQFDVIYCADFDSVAVGTGSLSKYFPGPDLLLLWHELASGQQGHMLGLGATPRPSLVGNVLLVDSGPSRASPSGVWRYVGGGLPPVHYTGGGLPSDADWAGVVSDPLNPLRWIIWANTDGTNPAFAYITQDGGLTWSVVTGLGDGVFDNTTVIFDIAFSVIVPGAWAAVGRDLQHFLLEEYGMIWFGTNAATGHAVSWLVDAFVGDGVNDELITVAADVDGRWASTGACGGGKIGGGNWPQAYYRYTSALADVADLDVAPWDAPQASLVPRTIDRLFGSSVIVAISSTPSDSALVFQSGPAGSVDVFTIANDTVSSTIADLGGIAIVSHADASPGPTFAGLVQITDLTGAPVESDIPEMLGQSVDYVRSDRLYHAVLACLASGSNAPSGSGGYIAVFDGASWSYLALPFGVALDRFAPRLDIIVEGT